MTVTHSTKARGQTPKPAPLLSMWVRNASVRAGAWIHFGDGTDVVALHGLAYSEAAWAMTGNWMERPEVLDFLPIEHLVVIPAGGIPHPGCIGVDGDYLARTPSVSQKPAYDE